MLVAVQSLGSIWTARRASTASDGAERARRGAYYNTTGILAGGKLRNRSCVYGYVRLDECSGFDPRFAGRIVHCVYESEGVLVWNGGNKLFLRQLAPAGTRPDVYLFRIGATDTGWMDRAGAWRCDAVRVISFSEGNGQQEALLVLPPFGWVRGENGTFCAEPRLDRPWIAGLSRAAR
ncbi:MAG: hypothetical protein ABSH45_20985 [Bryobacteraceae bacterium]|jgi:hypothetical protein